MDTVCIHYYSLIALSHGYTGGSRKRHRLHDRSEIRSTRVAYAKKLSNEKSAKRFQISHFRVRFILMDYAWVHYRTAICAHYTGWSNTVIPCFNSAIISVNVPPIWTILTVTTRNVWRIKLKLWPANFYSVTTLRSEIQHCCQYQCYIFECVAFRILPLCSVDWRKR